MSKNEVNGTSPCCSTADESHRCRQHRPSSPIEAKAPALNFTCHGCASSDFRVLTVKLNAVSSVQVRGWFAAKKEMQVDALGVSKSEPRVNVSALLARLPRSFFSYMPSTYIRGLIELIHLIRGLCCAFNEQDTPPADLQQSHHHASSHTGTCRTPFFRSRRIPLY